MLTISQPDKVGKQEIQLYETTIVYNQLVMIFAMVAMVTKFELLMVGIDQNLEFNVVNPSRFGTHMH